MGKVMEILSSFLDSNGIYYGAIAILAFALGWMWIENKDLEAKLIIAKQETLNFKEAVRQQNETIERYKADIRKFTDTVENKVAKIKKSSNAKKERVKKVLEKDNSEANQLKVIDETLTEFSNGK